MYPQSYFLFSGMFIGIVYLICVALTFSRSSFRFAAIPILLMGICCSYFSLDYFLGRAHPEHGPLGFHNPNLDNDGAVVVGFYEAGGFAYLTLQENNAPEPRLYRFTATPELLGMIKNAMKAMMSMTGGSQYLGFRIKKHPHGSGGGDTPGDTNYDFVEPTPTPLPPKDDQ